jgi:hypothetical protein
MLTGKKTYMTAAGGILAAVGSYLSGDMEMGTLMNIVVTALLAVFLRTGVKADTAEAAAAAEAAPAGNYNYSYSYQDQGKLKTKRKAKAKG